MKLFLRTPAGNLRDEGRRNDLVQLQKKKNNNNKVFD